MKLRYNYKLFTNSFFIITY